MSGFNVSEKKKKKIRSCEVSMPSTCLWSREMELQKVHQTTCAQTGIISTSNKLSKKLE